MKPLSELGLDKKGAEKFILENQCGVCQGKLTVAWGGSYGIKELVVRCGNNTEHSQFGRRKSAQEDMEEMMSNEQFGPQVGKRALAKVAPAIQPLMNKLAVTQDEAIIILKALWNDAPDIEVKKAAAYCAMYRLNPLKKHIALMKFWNKKERRYDWSMAEGIDATRLQVARKHHFSYQDGPRVMKEPEQTETFGETYPNDVVVLVVVKDMDTGGHAPGYGFWPKTKTYYDETKKADVTVENKPQGKDKGNSMFNMASIHAERQALRRLFPADLPESIPVFDERYEVLPETEQQEQPPVIESTGEIIEAEKLPEPAAEVIPPGQPSVTPAPSTEAPPASKDAAPRTFQNKQELIDAVQALGNVSSKDWLAQLGVKTTDDIKDWTKAYGVAVSFSEFLKKQPGK